MTDFKLNMRIVNILNERIFFCSEKVIRLLFAKLNGVAKERNYIKAKQRPLPSLKPEVIFLANILQ